MTVDQAMLADGSIICVTRTIPKLTADAFLGFVNNLPRYLSSHPVKKRQTSDERQADLNPRDNQVLQNWHQLDEITSFNHLSN